MVLSGLNSANNKVKGREDQTRSLQHKSPQSEATYNGPVLDREPVRDREDKGDSEFLWQR